MTWLCLGSAQAQTKALALDHIVERAWLEDPSGQLTWSDVQKLPAQPFSGALSRGFGTSVIWVRIRIDPDALPMPLREPDRLVLRIRPVYLDDIQVHDPLAPNGLAGVSGDQHHPRLDEFEGLDFMLPIARGELPRDLWLRLSSTSTRQIHVQALNVDDLNRLTHQQALVFACYIGLVLVFAVWGIVYWLFNREPVVGAFGLAQSMALVYALCSLGYLRTLWPLPWPAWLLDQASTVFSITAVSAAILFHVTLIRDFNPPTWARRLHKSMLWLFPLKVGLLAASLPTLALQLNLSEVLWSPLIFLWATWRSRAWQAHGIQRPTLSRPVVLAFYAMLMVMLVLAALPGLGLTTGGEIALYIVQAHGLLTAFLLLLMLQYRAHMLNKRQHEVALALERSQLQAERDRHVREEQDKLLAMLAHELKTPLATMQMRLNPASPGSSKIQQAIRDMNGVIERCLQTAQLNDGQLMAHPATVDLVKFLGDTILACPAPDRVHFSAPASLPFSTDSQLLFLVVNNLVENACKYAAPASPIHLALTNDQTKGVVRIDIRNLPGTAGWPDANQVFSKYYRSPKAKRQAGTGLGLFLARNLVHTLGGKISIEPDDTWVRFVVKLPLTD